MPTTKVTAVALAAALSVIFVWIASLFGLDIPPAVASAFTTVLSVGTGYLVPEKQA